MKYTYLLILLPFIMSCGTTKKGFGVDPEANFNSYKTFDFTEASTSGVKTMNKTRTLSAIANEMNSNGLIKSDNPDVLIDVVWNQNQTTNASKTEVVNPWRFGAWAGFEGTYTYLNVQNEAGLVISLVDTQTQKMVWVGSDNKHLDNAYSNQLSSKQVSKMVNNILKHYPPK